MLDKFNFYDILGYLIPGAAAIAVLYWVGTPVVTGAVPALTGEFSVYGNTISGAVALVALAYAVGHMVQALGWKYEDWGNKRRGARLSEQMLNVDEGVFSSKLVEIIRDRAHETFGVEEPPKLEGTYKSDSNVRLREVFELCYQVIEQKNYNLLTDLYLAISGLSRGLMVVSWLGFAISAVLVATALHQGSANRSLLWFADAMLATFAATWYLAHEHYYHFRRAFGRSVWTNFVAATGSETATKKQTGSSAVARKAN